MIDKKLLVPILAAAGVGMTFAESVSIHNPAPFPRTEVVEIPAEKILKSFGRDFGVFNADGKQLVHQFTHDGNLLVDAEIPAKSTIELIIKEGHTLTADTICLSQTRPDMQDDYAWENDRGGYRLYGASYRNGGGKVAGYDIWTKSVPFPVLAQRYEDNNRHGITYHKDHGNGMDAYTVGRTLGAGMNAVAPEGEIFYPCGYESCEILDNGPLRTTAKITCFPENIGSDAGVVEERVITLDKGSWLNKTEVCYRGLSEKYPLVTGIVVHRQNGNGYVIDPEKRYIAYADLTDNPDAGNGVIYIGIVNIEKPQAIDYEPFDPAQGDAVGQVVNKTSISPGETYTYYWGSGWSKGGVKGMQDWIDKIAKLHSSLQYPLIISVK